MIIKVGGRLKLVYLIKNNTYRRTAKNVRKILILIVSLSIFLCACKSIDISSNLNNSSNATQQNMEVTQASDEKELKWIWHIKPDKYNDLYFVDNDLIAVTIDYKKYVIVNTNDEIVIPFEYSSVEKFEDGFALVKDDENTFFINSKGENIFDLVFEDAYSFSDNLAAVKKENLWGYVDKLGNMVIKNQYDQVNSFNEGFATVKMNNKWGIIDNTGNVIIDFQYDNLGDFHEGFVAVAKDGKWGFVDKMGKIITDLQFDKVENFSEGFAAVMKNNKWGFIDKNGKIKITLKYDDVGNYSEGKASVKLSNNKDGLDEWAYIDSNDNIIIDFYHYDAADDQIFNVGEFNEGLAFVSKTLVSIIDYKGSNIFLGGSSEFFISSLNYNRELDAIPAFVYIDDAMKIKKYGLMGLTGSQRLEPVFDYISGIYSDYVVVEGIVNGERKKGLIKIYEE